MTTYLQHYGVKGMKWGVRKKREASNVTSARAKMKSAKSERNAARKEYNKAFNKSSSAYGAWGPGSNDRLSRTYDAARRYNSAQAKYKRAKKNYKTQLNSRNKRYDQVSRDIDQSIYGKGGVKRINRGMNLGDTQRVAALKETGRQAAAAFALSAGSIAVLMGTNEVARNFGKRAVDVLLKRR